MATLGNKYATIMDRAKYQDSTGKKLPFVAALSQANAIVNWLPFEECNQARSHEITVETYAPLPSTRILNRGVIPSFGKAMQIEEEVAQLKDWLEVDEDVANRGGDSESYRVEQSFSKLRAFGRKFAYLFFYGNRGSVPGDFNGMSMRYGAIAGAANAQNVLDAGGTGSNNTSTWLMGFGALAVTGIHPKGAVAGFKHRDWGLRPKTTATDTAGNSNASQSVFMDEFTWDGGLCLADWRHAVRIANIDVPSLNALTNDADLAYFLDEGWSRLPEETNLAPEPGVMQSKPVYYWFSNRTVHRNLRHQLRQTVIQGAGIRFENVAETPDFWSYNGRPWGIVDQIINTEARVV